jgi:hypothetical protein
VAHWDGEVVIDAAGPPGRKRDGGIVVVAKADSVC